MSDDYTTELNLLPVCSCGFVYTSGVEVMRNIADNGKVRYPTYEFIPSVCPNCGKRIVRITSPKYM